MGIEHNFRGNHKAHTKVIDIKNTLNKKELDSECCLCGKEMEYISVNRTTKIYGHNAEPLAEGHGRCCENCNYTKVITSRLSMLNIK
tara:strand:+ start:268 stop:528 length:261 start_codon:yes stop_codon:yes gene_type:complete